MLTSITRTRRRRLRDLLRGYMRARNDDDLKRLHALNGSLAIEPLAECAADDSAFFFGAAREAVEIAARQTILARLAGRPLNASLLSAAGRGSAVVHPLPRQWRAVLRQHGFAVAELRCALAWHGFVARLFARGLFFTARILASGVRGLFARDALPPERYAYFVGLVKGNLPSPGVDGRSHDIISWYAQWPGRVRGLDALYHDVAGAETSRVNGMAVRFSASPVLPPLGPHHLSSFFAWAVAAILTACIDWIRGRWWRPLLLADAAYAAAARLQPPERLAREYLFHNSNWILRPLWTYEAEAVGSRITFYFYSTNCEGFKRPDCYPAAPFGWSVAGWPRYLVWDEAQAAFVRRVIAEDAATQIVGSIWFSTSAAAAPPAPKRSIAVFDVTPHRTSLMATFGDDFEYYTGNTSIAFLSDIRQAAAAAGATLLWKRKREVGNFAHPAYRRFGERFANAADVVVVDSAVAAHRLIEYCALVVSMPFTSTALIARELGKPSCYYDPTGRVQRDDRAAHGIPVIHGVVELQSWLAAHLGEPSPSGGRTGVLVRQ